ncbi:MAG: DUF1592 domain-containing protein [Verrucomicrobiota bacterium]
MSFSVRMFLNHFLVTGIISSTGLMASPERGTDLVGPVEPFFDQHCYDCHDHLSKKGGLDLLSLSDDLSDPAVLEAWIRIYDRIRLGEMPPQNKPRPSPIEKAALQNHLNPALTAAHEARKETVFRRLNRQEYENTLNDLLGIHISIADRLPDDGRSHGFDTVGEALGISMVQLDEYLRIADDALDAAIADTISAPEVLTKAFSYTTAKSTQEFLGKDWRVTPDGATVFFHAPGYPTGMLKETSTWARGFYRIRISGYAYQSDRPITFSVGSASYARGSEKPIYGYFDMPPGDPTSIELVTWMDERHMVVITPQGLFDPERVIRTEGVQSYQGPGLAITQIELEGPLVEKFPSRGHQLIFEGLGRHEVEPRNPDEKTKPWYQPQFEFPPDLSDKAVFTSLNRFANAAFRRRATEEEVAPYLLLYQTRKHEGDSTEDALKTALSAMLCSPEFLFLKEPPGTLDDFAIASRLSYFLNRTAPDAELRSEATEQTLTRQPEALKRQAQRLMDHPHFDRFIQDFTDSWLDLRNIAFTNPDERLYPEFDRFLQHSAVEETRRYFRELIETNAGIETLVKSDFAMLNWRLAQHYGIEGVSQAAVERFPLPPRSPRGGFLSQASVLKVSANGTNTSPVLRGVWVNERILGHHPSPPPPGIPGVEPDIRGAETLRQILAQHRDSENCQSCHETIDPPGFALESFNPIGGWRTHFRSLGAGEHPVQKQVGNVTIRYKIGPEVDASGTLPDGRGFSGYEEYRNLIASDRDQLAKAFLTNLLIFATGREMGFSDRPEIEGLVQASAEQGHGIRDLVFLVLSSQPFLNK